MAKTKTSGKQKRLNIPGFVKHESYVDSDMANRKIVRELLIDCLMRNELDSFQDVLISYIRTSNKLGLSKKTKIGRTTLYDLIDPNKPFNPTFDTLGKIFIELAT